MNTSFIAYGIDVVTDPDLDVLTGTGQDGAGQVALQNGSQSFTDTQMVEVIVEQVTLDGELTGETRIIGINVYDSKADFDAGTVLYAYEPVVAGDAALVQETVAGMGDGYLQFDASILVSSDTGAPVLGTLFIAPGTDANDGYGALVLDNHSDTDLDGDGVIAAGTAEVGNGAFNTGYSDTAYAPPMAGDYVVEGGDGDDFIDPYYIADPEGDRIDGNDAADGSNDDVVRAGAGNDTVLAGGGNDYIDGGSGHDQLEGGDGDDTMLGGTGDDILYGGIGNDSAMGGEGADSFEAYDGNDYFNGGDGDDWMNGDKGDDTLLGGAGNDWMRASFGNDSMAGGTGNDFIWSGYGDDTITLENDFGNDTIEMEDQDEVNGDILDMSAVTDDLTVDLSPTNQGAGTVSDGTSTANFQGVEHLVLGSGTNTLVLADFSGTDRVEGFDAPIQNTDGTYSGKDLLDVSGLTDDAGNPVDVNDVVVSDDGAGNAVLGFPHGEALTLVGVAPADVSDVAQLVAMGIPAADTAGGSGDTGGGSGDTGGGSGAPDGSTTALNGLVEGGADSELIDVNFTGDPEGDRIDHNDAADGSNNDVVTAGDGDDTVLAGDGNDYIDGGSGHDQLEGGDGDDTMLGGTGDDILYGGIGNDSAMGGEGADSFEAYDGNDYFNGGDGDDWMNGDKGDDTLLGGAGDDWMRASFGNDSMAGGTGNDFIWSGYGDDTITLENDFGNDTIEMEDQDEVNGDILDMSAVTDDLTVDLSPTNQGAGTVSDGTSIANFQGVEHLVLGSGTNTLVLADFSGTDRVEGFDAPIQNTDGTYSGKDLLDVSGLTDDAGNPVDVNDVVVSDDGAGNALLSFPHGEALTLVGVAPADVSDVAQLAAMGIPADSRDGIVEGGSGSELIDDSFTGDPDGDRVDGGDAIDPGAGADDDSIRAGYGNDTIRAGLGNDTIDAEFGDDWIEAGAGDDLLIGGLGGDTMFGEAGNDSFQISSGDTAMGGDGDDSFFVDDSLRNGERFKIDGGADGETKGDTLYVNGPANITYDATDPETGSVEWLDGSVLYFSDIENVVHVPCFTENSMIKTLGGEKPARDIRPGDLVLTRDDGLQPVRWAGTRELSAEELIAKPGLRPVRIRKGALGSGMPCRDLIVSPQHRMLISGPKTELWFGSEEVFVAAIHLTCLDGVEQLGTEAVTYVHFMFEKHQLVQGDGAWSESFQPGDLSLLGMDEDQRDEIVSLFPQLMDESADTAYPAARQTLSARETRVLFA